MSTKHDRCWTTQIQLFDAIPIYASIQSRPNQRLGNVEDWFCFPLNRSFLSLHRNRFHSDDRPYSDQPLTSPSSSSSPSKFPFTFEELSQALLSYDAAEVFSAEALLYPSLSSNFTRRTFSSSSSSNSSWTHSRTRHLHLITLDLFALLNYSIHSIFHTVLAMSSSRTHLSLLARHISHGGALFQFVLLPRIPSLSLSLLVVVVVLNE